MEDINRNTARVIEDVRKYHGVRQAELAKLMGITQPTISKIENGVLLPDLTVWLNFVRHFKLLDPYCCYYGKAELAELPSISQLKLKAWKDGPWTLAKDQQQFVVTVRPLLPVIDFLRKFAEDDFSDLCETYEVKAHIFSILNLPLPWVFVKDLFQLLHHTAPSFSLDAHKLPHTELGVAKQMFAQNRSLEDFKRVITENRDLFFAELHSDARTKKSAVIPQDTPKFIVNSLDSYMKRYPAYVRDSLAHAV